MIGNTANSIIADIYILVFRVEFLLDPPLWNQNTTVTLYLFDISSFPNMRPISQSEIESDEPQDRRKSESGSKRMLRFADINHIICLFRTALSSEVSHLFRHKSPYRNRSILNSWEMIMIGINSISIIESTHYLVCPKRAVKLHCIPEWTVSFPSEVHPYKWVIKVSPEIQKPLGYQLDFNISWNCRWRFSIPSF
jgi:hypothetical protein